MVGSRGPPGKAEAADYTLYHPFVQHMQSRDPKWQLQCKGKRRPLCPASHRMLSSLRLAYKLPQTTVNEQSRLLRRPTADRSRESAGSATSRVPAQGSSTLQHRLSQWRVEARDGLILTVMPKVLWVFEHPGYAIAHARLALNVSDSSFPITPVESP